VEAGLFLEIKTGVISVTTLADTPYRRSDGGHPHVHIFTLTEPHSGCELCMCPPPPPRPIPPSWSGAVRETVALFGAG